MENTTTFEEFYEQYYSGAVYYVTGKLGHREDAEDLVSEAFAYCYSHFGDYDPEKSSLRTWLYVVIHSRLKNYYRDRKQLVDISELENVLPDEMSDVEQSVCVEDIRKAMEIALRALPERERRIIVLKYYMNKTSAEIADALGMSPVNVRVLLSRTLKKLQQSCGNLRDYL